MTVMSDTALQAAPATKARGYWATVGRRIARDKVSMVCAFILALIFLSALCAPWLGLADPYQGSMIRRLRHIGTPNYPLGTDELGRDMLARLVYGGRLSLVIGAACSAASEIAPIGSSLTSASLDARIDRGLCDIDQQIEGHEEQRQHQDRALQQRQVALEDRGIEQQAGTGP